MGRRQLVGQAGQHLPDPAHVIRHMPETVEDGAILYQAEVCVPAHGLKIKLLVPALAHLIAGRDIDSNEPVAKHLYYAHHPA